MRNKMLRNKINRKKCCGSNDQYLNVKQSDENGKWESEWNPMDELTCWSRKCWWYDRYDTQNRDTQNAWKFKWT